MPGGWLKWRTWCLLLATAVCLSAADTATRNDWPVYGGTPASWRYSALDQINTSNVQKLSPAWVFQTGDYQNGLQSTPIVIDGRMYLSTSSNWVFALDAATGRLLWEYHFPVSTKNAPYSNQNRGVAVAGGRVFMGTADNHMVALDQKTGRELWRVNVEDVRQCGCNITAAPVVVKDLVVTGVTGGDSVHRGYLTAFDVRTGRLRWRFYTIPGPGEKGHETWPGDSWRFGGGSTWMTGSFDPELNLLYWGVGNASADLDASNRRGDNLYTASVIALNPDTGKLQWHFQEVPQDVWDYDSMSEVMLVDLTIQGRPRKALLHATKTGYVWMLDRTNGQFLKAWQFVKNLNWVSGVTEDGKLVGRVEPEVGKSKFVCPSAIGGKNWNHGAYSPRTGFLYLPVLEICNDLIARPEQAEEGTSSAGGNWLFKAPAGGKTEGYIAAFDAVTGARQWTLPGSTFILASILATAGDLIFSGDPDGTFFALDARTGAKLWTFATGGGHRGSSITYTVGGRQYVATPTGWGSLIGRAFGSLFPNDQLPRSGSALFVFALPASPKDTP
jgi:alcohol dehydrogenase (cytochrome c)